MKHRPRLLLASIIATQLIAGLAIQLVVVAKLGAGRDTDIFVASQAVPAMLFAVLSVPLQNLWSPVLSVAGAQGSSWRVELSSALGQCSLLFGGMTLLLGISSFWWVPLVLPGFTPELHARTEHLTWLLLVATFFNGHAVMYAQALRGRERFVLPEMVNAICSIGAVLACWTLVPVHGIEAAAMALLLRGAVVTVWLALCCEQALPNIAGARRALSNWRQLSMLIGGGSICETVVLVDRYLSSLTSAGGMTAYNLARQGMGAAATIIDRTLTVPFMPSAARHLAERNCEAARRDQRLLTIRIACAAAVVVLGLFALSPFWSDLLDRVLGMRAPLAEQTWWICLCLTGYLLLMPAISGNVSMLFAMGDARSPTLISVAGFVVESSLKWLLFMQIGLPGLALATSIALAVNYGAGRFVVARRMRALEMSA